MPSARNAPPSRRRYQAEHPTVTIHCDIPTRNRLLALRARTGLSLGALVKQALGVLEGDLEAARSAGRTEGFKEGKRSGLEEGRTSGYAQGHKDGFAAAATRFRLQYPCCVCGQPVSIEVGDADATAVLQRLVADHWGHGDCIRSDQERRPPEHDLHQPFLGSSPTISTASLARLAPEASRKSHRGYVVAKGGGTPKCQSSDTLAARPDSRRKLTRPGLTGPPHLERTASRQRRPTPIAHSRGSKWEQPPRRPCHGTRGRALGAGSRRLSSGETLLAWAAKLMLELSGDAVWFGISYSTDLLLDHGRRGKP